MTQTTAPPPTTRSWSAPLRVAGVTAAALVAAGTLATLDPNQPGHYPTCPFLWATGLYCPGCGTLRAVHDLLHGDVVGALARNPLAVVLAPYVVYAYVCWVLRLSGRSAPHPSGVPAGLVWSLLAGILAFWVLRNVPGWTWLSPA